MVATSVTSVVTSPVFAQDRCETVVSHLRKRRSLAKQGYYKYQIRRASHARVYTYKPQRTFTPKSNRGLRDGILRDSQL